MGTRESGICFKHMKLEREARMKRSGWVVVKVCVEKKQRPFNGS